MAQRQMRAVVVGASTLLGKELVEELNGSPAAAWDIRLLDEQEEGESQLSTAGDEAVLIQPLTRDALGGADLVFFAGDASTAREYSREALKQDAAVIDLTSTFESEPGYLLRSPWLPGAQRPDLQTTGIVALHPATLMIALVCDRLHRRLGLERFTATLLEPASQAGRAGVDELHQQNVSLLSFQTVPQEIYDTQVAFNLQSKLGDQAKAPLGNTRQRIEQQLTSLLGPELAGKIRVELLQAPVFHGYTISAYADFARSGSPAEIMDALNGGVIVAEADTLPSNTAVTDTGDLLIAIDENGGGVRSGTWLWMAADNLRFTARNAVAAALELAAMRPAAQRVQ